MPTLKDVANDIKCEKAKFAKREEMKTTLHDAMDKYLGTQIDIMDKHIQTKDTNAVWKTWDKLVEDGRLESIGEGRQIRKKQKQGASATKSKPSRYSAKCRSIYEAIEQLKQSR